MKKYQAEFVFTANIVSEVQANSIEEAKSLLERNLSMFNFLCDSKVSTEEAIFSLDAYDVKIEDDLNEFKIEEIEEFSSEIFNLYHEESI